MVILLVLVFSFHFRRFFIFPLSAYRHGSSLWDFSLPLCMRISSPPRSAFRFFSFSGSLVSCSSFFGPPLSPVPPSQTLNMTLFVTIPTIPFLIFSLQMLEFYPPSVPPWSRLFWLNFEVFNCNSPLYFSPVLFAFFRCPQITLQSVFALDPWSNFPPLVLF